MASRSLTDIFILMRNNAMQNRHIFSEQHDADDRVALVGKDGMDIELGSPQHRNSSLPPQWSGVVDEVQYEITKIQKKIKELSVLHDRHLHRPMLDDSTDEEKAIETLTQDITQMFHRCQRTVQRLSSSNQVQSGLECRLSRNITSSVARSLQDLSSAFRTSQSSYLRKLQGREERAKQYFEEDLLFSAANETDELFNMGFATQQQQFVNDNTLAVQQRETEILQIVRSIQDLNDIFKELAAIVVDQGTILDRIDYNIEQAATHVEKGLVQLQKAEKYQKKNRKMLVIAVLFAIIIVLLITLIAFKAR